MNYRLLDRGETMQEGDEALVDPKEEKWGPIPHWSIGMPYRSSNNPVRRALDVSLDAESVIERLQASIEHSAYFNGVRFARLWHWAHEELTEELKSRFFCIVANGTADHMEQPTYAQQFNAMKHRAERAESELAKLRATHGVTVPPSVGELDRAWGNLPLAFQAHPGVKALYRIASAAALGVPSFDLTQPCAMSPHGQPLATMCPRCKNPHHACDNGTPGVSEARGQTFPPTDADGPKS